MALNNKQKIKKENRAKRREKRNKVTKLQSMEWDCQSKAKIRTIPIYPNHYYDFF
jgi:hypothetical protein